MDGRTKCSEARVRASIRTDGTAFVDGLADDVHDTSQGRAADGDLWMGGGGDGVGWDRVRFCPGSRDAGRRRKQCN